MNGLCGGWPGINNNNNTILARPVSVVEWNCELLE